ncbi:hypothetical protein MSHRCOH1_08115 [Candidatus Ornithobacterium hominis]|nr:hypothetical protein MSHRCOH1_08115 [Candidatus Ornithobacterium hominis]
MIKTIILFKSYKINLSITISTNSLKLTYSKSTMGNTFTVI